MTNNGIVYICFENKHNKRFEKDLCLKEMKFSISSSQKQNPNTPITVFTDYSITIPDVNVVKINSPKSNRIKQDILPLSPYENTLYVDTDTMFVNSIEDIFTLGQRFDVGFCIDYLRLNTEKPKSFIDYFKIPPCFPEYGGGVMFYTKSKQTLNFLKFWKSKHQESIKHGIITDQQSLRVSLWQCENLNFFTLPPEFNLRTQEKAEGCKKRFPIKDRIYHWHKMFNPNIHNSRTPYNY
jgi:hypothetical protein